MKNVHSPELAALDFGLKPLVEEPSPMLERPGKGALALVELYAKERATARRLDSWQGDEGSDLALAYGSDGTRMPAIERKKDLIGAVNISAAQTKTAETGLPGETRVLGAVANARYRLGYRGEDLFL